MRFPILLATAAALGVAACDSGVGFGGGDQSGSSQSQAAQQYRAALEEAPKHGLTTDLFLEGDAASASEDQLRQGALQLASALANGKVDPTKIRDVYTLPRPKVNVEQGFEQAANEGQLVEWLNSLAPQSDEYRALSQAFVQLVERVPSLEGTSIPTDGEAIKPGQTDPRVPAIAANLRAQGYLQPAQAEASNSGGEAEQNASGQAADGGQPTLFTEDMARALAQWQQDSGLKSDGVVGPNTIEQLNAGPKDRARKLAIALERLRWLEREAPPTRIDVNTAAAVLTYFRDGRPVDQRNVVVGEPGWETPQLSSPMFRLVANPNWTVPDSIVEDEISKKSSAWLRSNNFAQVDGRWVQQPGPQNALGEVKLDMKNDHAIYLHDTPAKALFTQEERHRSHGCVRVQDALGFARMIAQHNGVLDQFNQAMGKDEETFVALPNELPVRLIYRTAYLGSGGRVQFADDAYGWDNDVAVALGYSKREVSRQPHRNGADVGP